MLCCDVVRKKTPRLLPSNYGMKTLFWDCKHTSNPREITKMSRNIREIMLMSAQQKGQRFNQICLPELWKINVGGPRLHMVVPILEALDSVLAGSSMGVRYRYLMFAHFLCISQSCLDFLYFLNYFLGIHTEGFYFKKTQLLLQILNCISLFCIYYLLQLGTTMQFYFPNNGYKENNSNLDKNATKREMFPESLYMQRLHTLTKMFTCLNKLN